MIVVENQHETGSHPLDQFIQSRINAGSENLYREVLEWCEAILLPHVLTHTENNQSSAAKLLGISRGNLRGKLRRPETPAEACEP